MNLQMVEHTVRMRHAALTEEADVLRAVREARSAPGAPEGRRRPSASAWLGGVRRRQVPA